MKLSRGDRWLSLLTVFVAASALAQSPAQLDVQGSVDTLVEQGKFTDAAQFIRRELNPLPETAPERKALLFELDRLERIKKDFPLTEGDLFTRLQKSVKDLRWDEYQRWIRDGWFDRREIDGERRYMVSSVSNLRFRHSELDARWMLRKRSQAYERKLLDTIRAIRASARYEERPYVLPKTFRVEMTLKVAPGAAPTGEVIRAWMPVPRKYPFQDGFNLLSSTPPVLQTAPEDSTIRSVLQEARHSQKGTEFQIEYEYTARGVKFETDYAKYHRGVSKADVLVYTNLVPHVSFSPEVRALSKRLVGNDTNPWVKAKRFYDWIADNIHYSYAVEYSTIRNISEYCLERGYGDCGQEALLFISLCRLNGIPARWQSGWSTFPGAKTIHDWTEIYIEPYGWMPVDPYMGIYAMQYASTLSLWERLELRDFYFGGLDQYRLIANSDHNQELAPAKRALRSDTVDFQRGELEYGGHNIYFDQFDYELVAKEIKPQATLP